MGDWGPRYRWHVRLDPSLRTYVAQVVALVGDRPDADVLDVAAGSGWVGQFSFKSYRSLDIVPPHERWDLDEPLPDEHVGGYDLVVCLGALHYTHDPRRSFGELVRALRPAGELVVAVPWLYPPHDIEDERWRISPRELYRLVGEHFDTVELHPNGSAFHLPLHVLNRYITGPFRGVGREVLDSVRDVEIPRPWRTSSVDEVPVSRTGPMVVLARASGLRRRGTDVSREQG